MDINPPTIAPGTSVREGAASPQLTSRLNLARPLVADDGQVVLLIDGTGAVLMSGAAADAARSHLSPGSPQGVIPSAAPIASDSAVVEVGHLDLPKPGEAALGWFERQTWGPAFLAWLSGAAAGDDGWARVDAAISGRLPAPPAGAEAPAAPAVAEGGGDGPAV